MSFKTAYFDCAFGAAGDMLVGACIDSGVDGAYVESELRKLNLPANSFALTFSKVHRASIHATKFDVSLDNKNEQRHEHSHQREHSHDQEHSHAPGHTHSHSHSHSHAHTDDDSHGHTHGHANGSDQPERALSNILKMIDGSALEPAVKDLAGRIFKRLGRAESAVHGVDVEKIHFHEVGAVDAICDIVGFAIAYTKLGIERAYVSPLPLGTGTVQTMHGRYPVPGPAVLALLRDAHAQTSSFALPYECLTPTGAAILCEVAHDFGNPPAFVRIDQVGYGAGTLNPGGHPNVVRLLLGQSVGGSKNIAGKENTQESAGTYEAEVVAVVEANIDDLSPAGNGLCHGEAFAGGRSGCNSQSHSYEKRAYGPEIKCDQQARRSQPSNSDNFGRNIHHRHTQLLL